MTHTTPVAPFLRRFLLEHLIQERNMSRNTQAGYRDALLQLLPFVARRVQRSVDRLHIEDFTADTVRQFLTHLERERSVSIQTRNQRLVAIHSLARFIGERSPEHLAWCAEVRSVPFKRAGRKTLPSWRRTRWMPCLPRQIAGPLGERVTMPCCCSLQQWRTRCRGGSFEHR